MNQINMISNECQLPSTITVAKGMPFRKRLRQLIKERLGEGRIRSIRRYFDITRALVLKTEEKSAPSEPVIITPAEPLKAGDWVRVRLEDEITATLDQNGKFKGCGFMKNNGQNIYCGSEQRVHSIVNLFIDERDMSKARKAKGLVMLEGVMCEGGQGIGRCDRSCLMFWREEWLQKIERSPSQPENQTIHTRPGGKTSSSLKSANVLSKAFKAGDLVRIRSKEEILATLDQNGKLGGCSFISNMVPYCGSRHRVLKPMERYFSEIDNKVKTCKGLFILEGVTCNGETRFGHCDRSCLVFWREEWLEKV
ncbi:MAG: hypothetical protein ABFC94_14500 [Syntrophomonas sp.]